MGTPGFVFFFFSNITLSYCIMYSQMQQECFIWVLLMLIARFKSISDVFDLELVVAKQRQSLYVH